jgi:hypothetical protein
MDSGAMLAPQMEQPNPDLWALGWLISQKNQPTPRSWVESR